MRAEKSEKDSCRENGRHTGRGRDGDTLTETH